VTAVAADDDDWILSARFYRFESTKNEQVCVDPRNPALNITLLATGTMVGITKSKVGGQSRHNLRLGIIR